MWRKLSDFLADRRRSSPYRAQYEGVQALQDAREALLRRFSSVIAEDAHPKKLVDGTLTIEVSHPAIAQAVRQQEQTLLQALQEKHHRVQRIVFSIRQETTESSG